MHMLDQMANRFETYASDQRQCVRWASTKKAKEECLIKASVWDAAANELRNMHVELEAIPTGPYCPWPVPAELMAQWRRGDLHPSAIVVFPDGWRANMGGDDGWRFEQGRGWF